MKARLSGYFDVGFSIGIDDVPFANLGKEIVEKCASKGFVVVEQSSQRNTLTLNASDVKLGQGVLLDLSNSAAMAQWKNDAATVANDSRFAAEFDLNLEQTEQLKGLLNNPQLQYSAHLRLFSFGVATIELSVDNIDNRTPSEVLMRFVQLFENAAYSTYGSTAALAASLYNLSREVLSAQCTNALLRDNTNRPKEQSDDFAYTLFPSFTITFRSDNRPSCEQMVEWRETQGDQFTRSSLDSTTVWSSWYVLVQYATDCFGLELEQIVNIYNLFYATCESFNGLLSKKIVKLFYAFDRSVDNRLESLLEFKILSCMVVNYTNFSMLTQNIELMQILKTLDQGDKLESWHKHINTSVETLNSIQEQLNRNIEKENDEQEKRRDNRINKFVMIITTFTFVSVVADFTSINDRLNIIPTAVRLSIYGVILVLLAVIIHKLYKGKQ